MSRRDLVFAAKFLENFASFGRIGAQQATQSRVDCECRLCSRKATLLGVALQCQPNGNYPGGKVRNNQRKNAGTVNESSAHVVCWLFGRCYRSAILKQMVRDAFSENEKLKAQVSPRSACRGRLGSNLLRALRVHALQVEMLEGSQTEAFARSQAFSHSSDIPDVPLQGMANLVSGRRSTATEPEPELGLEDAVSEVTRAIKGRLANFGVFGRIGAQQPTKMHGL